MTDGGVGGRWLETAAGRVPVEVAATRAARRRGLLGRDHLAGGLLLLRTRSVHTFGMRFPIDVVLLDRDGLVVHVATLRPGRITRPRRGARSVLELPAGASAEWSITVGAPLRLGP